ncbi:MAG: hypothetical protein ABL876_02210 [Chitinophagaceae bacterium]
MKKILFLLATATPALSAWAHEGHGHTHEYTITHYFVEPEHIFPILAVLAIGVLLFTRLRRKSEKN